MASTAKHDWPMVPLLEIAEDVTRGHKKVPKSAYEEEGSTPIVDQSMDFICGYTDEVPTLVSPPYIVFGDHTRELKHIDFAFVPGADGVKVLKPAEGIEPKFLYYYLQAHPVKDLGYSRHFKLLKELSISLPPLVEQRRIAAILDEVGALIAKVGTEMSNLQKIQQSRLDGVFRHFPQAPLRMYVESIQSGKSLKEASTNDVRNRVLKISSVTSGTFEPEESKPLPDDYIPPEAHRVQKGDVLVSRANTADLVGASVLVMEEVSNLYLPDKLWRLNLTQGTQPAAIVGILQNAVVRSRISAKASGSGGSMKNITQKAFLQVLVPNMCTSEQVELSNFLFEIGRVRKLLTQKKTLLETLQRSLSARAFQGEL